MAANHPSDRVFFYVMVESKSFGSLAAMFTFLKVPISDLQLYLDNARFHDSNIVVIDKLVLGKPEDKICAVVVSKPGGAVMLCFGLFGDLYETQDEAQAAAQQLAEDSDFKGRFIGVASFRPTAINREMPQ